MKRGWRITFLVVGIVAAITFLFVLGFDYCLEQSDPQGYRNSKLCYDIAPGVTINDLKTFWANH